MKCQQKEQFKEVQIYCGRLGAVQLREGEITATLYFLIVFVIKLIMKIYVKDTIIIILHQLLKIDAKFQICVGKLSGQKH